jgi:hypothetical protein
MKPHLLVWGRQFKTKDIVHDVMAMFSEMRRNFMLKAADFPRVRPWHLI